MQENCPVWICAYHSGLVQVFLLGRSQRVKIGSALSPVAYLASGVPQGGVISPFIFVLYVSDLELWLKWSSAKIYADDTTTTTTAKNLEELIRRMEEDAATKKLHLIAPNKKGS